MLENILRGIQPGSVAAMQMAVTYWHVLPMAIMISLVYSASRVELPEAILKRSVRLFTTIMVFMGLVFALLWFLSSEL